MAEAEEARWLDESQQQSWRALMMGITLLLDRLDADLRRGFDISLAEYEILVRLSERPQRQLRMAQLADAMAHSRSRVTHTVKRMENAGLVERADSTEDGRGVVCAMTDEGYHLLERMAPTHVSGVRDYLVDLATSEDFAALGPGDERRRRQARGHPPRERDPLSQTEVLAPPPPRRRPLVRAIVAAIVLGLATWGVLADRGQDPARPAAPSASRGHGSVTSAAVRTASLGPLPDTAGGSVGRRWPLRAGHPRHHNAYLTLLQGVGQRQGAPTTRRFITVSVTASRPYVQRLGRGGDLPLAEVRRTAHLRARRADPESPVLAGRAQLP